MKTSFFNLTLFIKQKKLILLVLLLFLATRLYKISTIPSSVYWDEASIGYNAFSIVRTGLDEWGVEAPLYFKAFGEFKLPVYIYSVTLLAKLFGMSTLVLRLPSVIYSACSIVVLYALTRKLLKNKKVALFTALIFTTTSWFFIFSRTGYEVSAGLFFYLLGLLLMLRKSNVFKQFLGVSAFVLSIYSYNSFVVLAPITLVVVMVFNFLLLDKFKAKKVMLSLVLSAFFVALSFPVYNFAFSAKDSRYKTSSILFEKDKKLATIKKVVLNYMVALNPKYLFLSGDPNSRSQIPNYPQVNLLEGVTLLYGLLHIVKLKNKSDWLILVLLILSILPTSLSKEPQNALRSLPIVPFLAIIEAIGITAFIEKYTKYGRRIALIFVMLVLLFFTNFLVKFYGSYNQLSAEGWQWAYKDIFVSYRVDFENFDHIVVTDHYGQPYIFALYYNAYDPITFRSTLAYNQTRRFATSVVSAFDKYIFTNIDYYNLPSGKSLIFAHPSERMTEIEPKESVYFPNGSLAFIVYEFKK